MNAVERIAALQANRKAEAQAKAQAEKESKRALWARIKTDAPELAKLLVELKEAGLSPQIPRVTWPESPAFKAGDEIGPKTYVWIAEEINGVAGIVWPYRGKQVTKRKSYGRKQRIARRI